MDLIDRIRRKYFREEKSIRQIARELNCSRNTVRKYIFDESEPIYKQRAKRESPVKSKVEPAIDQILNEWSSRTTRKQRITGSRLHDELLTRGFEVGITTVRTILREKDVDRLRSLFH